MKTKATKTNTTPTLTAAFEIFSNNEERNPNKIWLRILVEDVNLIEGKKNFHIALGYTVAPIQYGLTEEQKIERYGFVVDDNKYNRI